MYNDKKISEIKQDIVYILKSAEIEHDIGEIKMMIKNLYDVLSVLDNEWVDFDDVLNDVSLCINFNKLKEIYGLD